MKKKIIDLSTYHGRDTVYVSSKEPCICHIYQWCSKAGIYKKRVKGNRYYVYKQIKKGKKNTQYSKSFETYQEAKDWKKTQDISVSPDVMTFAELKEIFLKEHSRKVKATSIVVYRRLAIRLVFFDEYYVSQIDSKLVDRWLNHVCHPSYLVNKKITRTSYEQELMLLRLICSYYGEYINDNYTMPIKKRHSSDCIPDKEKYLLGKSKRKLLTKSEYRKLIKHLEDVALGNSKIKEKVCAFAFLLQALTGLRVGEIFALDWSDVCFVTEKLAVSKTVHWLPTDAKIAPMTKTNVSRVVPLVSQALNALKKWQLLSGKRNGLVFQVHGKIVSRHLTRYYMDKFSKIAGIGITGTHKLRHTFGTLFYEASNDPNALKAVLGHSKVDMSFHYAQSTDESVAQGIMKFGAATTSLVN
jgi:integrase